MGLLGTLKWPTLLLLGTTPLPHYRSINVGVIPTTSSTIFTAILGGAFQIKETLGIHRCLATRWMVTAYTDHAERMAKWLPTRNWMNATATHIP